MQYLVTPTSYITDATALKFLHVTNNINNFLKKQMKNLTKNTPGVKKERPRTKTGLAEKEAKPNGQPRPPHFDRFESFGHDDLTAKRYLRCSRPPNVDVINIFDKDDQATKTLFFFS